MPEMFASFNSLLAVSDPEISRSIDREFTRQASGLELIASENYASAAVLEAQGTVLTNKYAEGYPSKRYYGGCQFVDEVETLAISRVCKLFGSQAANVQPHSGSQANMAAYMALAKPGDKVMGMSLSNGGHLTHGSAANFSGKLYQILAYGIDTKTHRIDMDQVRDLAKKESPRIIIAGASAYPRIIDFQEFGKIAQEVGADLVVDMAHIAGLVAAGLHPSPIPYATYVTSTTHKTLRGPRGGLILCKADKLKAVNSLIFPGIQGGPLMHVIAAKAVAFNEALSPSFITYQKQVLKNASALAQALIQEGFNLVSDGTDNHLMLVDLAQSFDGSVTGKEAEAWLDLAGITVNKNTVPNEARSPFVTSGIRIGTPAITTRGLDERDCQFIAQKITEVIKSKGDSAPKVKNEIKEMCLKYPLYQGTQTQKGNETPTNGPGASSK